MQENDLCDIIYVTDRRLSKAIFEDMRIESSALGGMLRWGERLEIPQLRSNTTINNGVKSRSYREFPPAGAGTKTFIANVLPKMTRLSTVIER